ncbi:MAG: spermidine/putrescine ABC transporter substrate-binding protein [Actinomycetia bacterium]|nr:spermidine/putrescine ABC transporter substrate-binding protein [Actinomycetes bacterium]
MTTVDPSQPRRRGPARQPHRRDVLRGGMWLAAGAVAAPWLSACSSDTPGAGAATTDYEIATPTSPIKLPIFDDNQPIESGLEPEGASVLRVLNYAEFLAPSVLRAFEEKYGVEIQVTPYGDFEELVRRMVAPGANFDVIFAGPTIMNKMVYGKLIQPFNASYVPNIKNVWPQFQDPWYDLEAQYTAPYNVYTTGIGYRADRVAEVPDNGYMMLWDPQYSGQISILDDGGSALQMAMLAWGITDDINTDNVEYINAAKEKLIELNALDVKVIINQYQTIPSGRVTVGQAWSGDLTFAESYLTGGATLEDLGYWLPESKSERQIGNETISVGKAATSPVLGHTFINYLLDNQVAETNSAWTGYQPPISTMTPERLIEVGIFSEILESTIVLPGDFAKGLQSVELPVSVENLWLRAWQEVQGG